MRAFRTLASLLVLTGCGASLPALTDGPVVPDAPDDAGDVDRGLRERMDGDLRSLYAECVRTRDHLSEHVSDAEGEEALLMGAAVGAATAGQAASSSDNTEESGQWVQRGRSQPNAGQSTSAPVKRSAEEHVGLMNAALRELREFLYLAPMPERWTETERADYEKLLRRARGECRP